jgi:signal transduction histidine kinase
LTVRITLVFATVALLASVLVAGSAYAFTFRYLVHHQNDTVTRQTYVNAATVRDRMASTGVDVTALIDALPIAPTSNVVIYHSGQWSSSSLTVSRDALPADIKTAGLRGHPVRAWVRIASRPQLVVAVPLPAVHAVYFQTFDESELEHTLFVLRVIVVVAAAATTLTAGFVGWRASRRLTAPLRAIAAAADRISAGDLGTQLSPAADADLAGLVNRFNDMVQTLRARIERDARFAADVSHELRSPLTTLATSLSVLQQHRDELSPRNRDALDLITAELARFQRLVADLLEIATTDAGAASSEREPVRICQLVLNVLARPEYATISADVDSSALDAVVLGDKRRLEQTVRNLLDNAVAHAGAVERVGLHREDGAVQVVVDDTGPGVPAADRELIFERFARGRGAGRRGSGGGTGLGLALVREHVGAHGGRVWVTDRPGGGARFVVELPVQAES